jgi:hypothetical protein
MKKEEEAKKRGEFIDIHDVGGVDPQDFDVLLTDMDNNTLHSDISALAGVPYLKEAMKDEADKKVASVQGFVYGRLTRNIFPCTLSIQGKACWVFFLVCSGAPLTYISAEVS